MKTTLTFLLALAFCTLSHAQVNLNLSFVGQVEYSQDLSDIWGYVAPDDTEYALVGVQNGLSIVNLSDPANPVESAFVPGISSTWRGMVSPI